MAHKITFTQEQVQANLRSQRDLADLLPVIDEAEECGVHVDGYREIAKRLADQLHNIHTKFMSETNKGG